MSISRDYRPFLVALTSYTECAHKLERPGNEAKMVRSGIVSPHCEILGDLPIQLPQVTFIHDSQPSTFTSLSYTVKITDALVLLGRKNYRHLPSCTVLSCLLRVQIMTLYLNTCATNWHAFSLEIIVEISGYTTAFDGLSISPTPQY